MSDSYKLNIKNDTVGFIDGPKCHGDIVSHNGEGYFVLYTKGKTVFAVKNRTK